ncbi:outer membrane protein assembly factor [Xylanibacter ruminicola]|uniref:Beta-barrel assembly machine subunit BamA n=1 Tax=Xylanibacter ruminicola TaxID=839 RepID=A0A1M6TID9_XYLRU|nr:POTRA domain-containing protein [Xylanibacter ruminicola]SHK56643.1 Beta-barrel assembly machine subunit BamA [Xylanibacter ruminicola]
MLYNIIRYKEVKGISVVKVLVVLFTIHCSLFASTATAQDKIVNPDISYAGTPRTCEIGGIAVEGVEGYEDYVLAGLSGLTVGQEVELPGSQITEAVKRYWRNGLFSKVQITADSIVGNKVYLCIHLGMRPRIKNINYNGIKKSEREDMEAKLGMVKGMSLTRNIIDRAKILAKRYFDDKGYKNAEIEIVQREDASGQVTLDVNIDKKDKMKVHELIFQGNEKLSVGKIKGSMFSKGAFGKIHEAGKLNNFFKAKKFTDERYKEAKQALIDKYNELGFRDATILEDSVYSFDDKHVNILVKIDEGEKYYVRDITWVGNTVVTTDYLNAVLGMKRGDVYNQKHIDKRLKEDDDAAGNWYYNNGYVFSNIDPVEVNIDGDSIDIEMRVTEGPQARLNHVRIYGNDRLYEEVVRRELRTKPGDLFNKEALMRSARDIASMGFFDPEKVVPDVKPNVEDGSVDINWKLEQKSNDQLEFSLGWGQTGVIGKIGIKFNNFSIRNLFGKNKLHRGILPYGDGEQLGFSFQTNGSYYSSLSANYGTNWFGGKRPNSLNVGVFYSKQSDISSYYRNNAFYNNYAMYSYGYGSYNPYYYNYESMLDDDKTMTVWGASLGWGKRLRWPDDYFQFSAQLGYSRYMLRDWSYFYIHNGNCNNINLGLTLSRTSTDNQLFPRRGSEFMASVTVTPPWSLFDNKDYANLAKNSSSATYEDELQDVYRWIEYHKWKFKSRTFTALTGGQKCFVLMTRVEMGLLGSYNKDKRSPFETFYVGGDGMSGYSYGYSEETIGLRGYDNGALSYSSAYETMMNGGTISSYNSYAYDRFTLELRYPFMLGNTTIYGLGFVEGGNAWANAKDFNPFKMKRSAGLGVRIYLPMVGLMGIDWAYGFDNVYTNQYGAQKRGGSNFHFILGQEF